MGDDLADDRCDGLAVAEHAALDLHTVDALLDEHLVVVPAGQRDSAGQFPDGSVNRRVEDRLIALADQRRRFVAMSPGERT